MYRFGVYVGKGIISDNSNMCVLANLTNKTVCLPKGTIIANKVEVEAEDYLLLAAGETVQRQDNCTDLERIPEGINLSYCTLKDHQKSELTKLLVEYKSLFSHSLGNSGSAKGVVHNINTETTKILKKFNKLTKKDVNLLPRIEDTLNSLGK